MSKVVTMRIRFPQTYPVIYKTLRIDGEMPVKDAIIFIAEALHMPPEETIGLYLPTAKKWLDADTQLAEFQDEIAEEDNVEYKYTNQKDSSSGGGCCILL